MPITAEALSKYRNRVLIETGTCNGEGVRRALQAGFKEVRSVELSDHWYGHCVREFCNNDNVRLYYGLTEDLLWAMIRPFEEPLTFWLDGHYSGEGTALGPKSCPLLEELAIIGKHPVKTHTILIDDMRCWRKDDPTIGFGEAEIVAAILNINPKYYFAREDGHIPGDVLVARVGA